MIREAVLGYVIGSLPLGYLMGRWSAGVDLRRVGSGNVGATNMYRVSGVWLALTVMLIDLAKGAAAVSLAGRGSAFESAAVVAGVAAVTGHVFPVWIGGRGGKGVATAFGAFLFLAPLSALVAATAFVLAVWATRLVSLGSVIASLTLPTAGLLFDAPRAVVWGATVTSALVVWRHRSNLARLKLGTERRLAPPGTHGDA
jgi:acyl phosphate:glycerol-3-phosphate acyltransferase